MPAESGQPDVQCRSAQSSAGLGESCAVVHAEDRGVPRAGRPGVAFGRLVCRPAVRAVTCPWRDPLRIVSSKDDVWLPRYANWPSGRCGSRSPRASTRASAHGCRVFLFQKNAADHRFQKVQLRQRARRLVLVAHAQRQAPEGAHGNVPHRGDARARHA